MPQAQQNPLTSAIASRRILRLALGTSLAMGFSLMVNWPLSFLAAVFTLLILSMPLPAFTLKTGIKFVLALVVPAYAGLLLLPFLTYSRSAGVLMVVLALFGSFYYSARGGSPILGLFMTMAVTMVVTVGSISAEIMLMVVNAITIAAAVGIAFNFISHALIPDAPLPAGPAAAQGPATKPTAEAARRNAMRSMLVVLPIVIPFLFISSSASYIPVMIKVASMGQQATADDSRAMGWQQLESTFWGGIGAIIAWYVMGIWPTLLIFCLLIALACLIYGARIFQGAGMHPKAEMWSYALMTMVIVITPSVMDSAVGSAASSAFYTRLLIFVFIAIYGTLAVMVFDAFSKSNKITDLPPQQH